jgi:phosphohistidine swiveling domain-containing protein
VEDAWDPLHNPGSPGLHWSTDNVGEAAPGVLTPMCWSLWGAVGDSMPRAIAYAMGAFSKAEAESPAPGEDRIVHPYFGRIAMRMEYLGTLGDRMPGTSGAKAVAGLFGRVPETMVFRPTVRRYPIIAVKLPIAFAQAPARVRRLARETDAWWRDEVPRLAGRDLRGSIAAFSAAYRRFDHALIVHSLGLLAAVQPLYDGLAKVVERAGVGDLGALSGSGGAELAIVSDIWRAAQGQIALDEVIVRHGFHGPREGEISSRVWREDSSPLLRLLDEYAGREDPLLRDEAARRRLPERQREVLAALPRARRPAALLLMRMAADRIPLRGVGKRAFLQALDVARGTARRAGECLAADSTLDDPEDVFYLTADELTSRIPGDAKELVARRRERRAEYEQLTIPTSWQGTPTPTRIDTEAAASDDELVTGLGVSAGVVEGTVRIVTDPGFADVEPGEVLVTPTTDPSWASIMFISSALVVDIGGALSHAAVVARELGIPCVVNTRSGTRALRTGDRVRVDGSKGTVEVLERQPAVAESAT